MIPERLYIEGFRSFTHPVEIDFGNIEMASITGPNGSGKSSLIEAMLFALFNKVRTRTTGEAISQDKNSLLCELDFRVDDGRYRVRRQYSKNRHYVAIFVHRGEEYEKLPIEKVADADSYLIKLVGMPYESFVKSSILLQGEASAFSKLSPANRMQFFSQILHLELFEDLAKKARSQASIETAVIENDLNRLAGLSSKLQDIGPMEKELSTKSNRLNEIDDEIETLSQWRKEIVEKRIEHNRLISEKESLEKQLNQTRGEYSEKAGRRRRLKKNREEIQTILADEESIIQEYEKFKSAQQDEKRLAKLKDKKSSLNKNLDQLERKKEAIEADNRRKLEILETEQKSLKSQIEELRENIQKKQIISAGLERLKKTRKELDRLRENEKHFEKLDRQLMVLRTEIDKQKALLDQKLANLFDEKTIMQQTVERLGDADLWLSDLKDSMEERKRMEKRAENISIAIAGKQESQRNIKKLIEQAVEQIAEFEERLQLLRQQSGGECPLCGTELGESHKQNIIDSWKEEIRQKQDEKLQLSRQIEKIQSEIESLQRKFDEVSEAIARKEHLEKQFVEYEANIRERENAKKRIVEIDEEIDEIEKSLKNSDFAIEMNKEMESLKIAIEELGFSKDALKQAEYKVENLSHFAVEMEYINKSDAKLDQIGIELGRKIEEYTELKSKIDDGSFTKEIDGLLQKQKREIDQIDYSDENYKETRAILSKYEKAPTEMQRLENARENRRKIDQEISELEISLDHLEKTGKLYCDNIDKLTEMIIDYADIEKLEAETELKLSNFIENRDRLREELVRLHTDLKYQKEIRDEIKQIEVQTKKRRRFLENAEILGKLCGRRGVQKFLVDRMIPLIERECNSNLSRLLPGVDVLFTSNSQNSLELTINRDGVESPYESLSGGERFRVDFALRIALSRLIAMRFGQRIATLIIDEGFGTQDREGLSLMVDKLLDIRSEFEKILVITHLESLKTEFPTNISLYRNDNFGSRIEVGAMGSGS